MSKEDETAHLFPLQMYRLFNSKFLKWKTIKGKPLLHIIGKRVSRGTGSGLKDGRGGDVCVCVRLCWRGGGGGGRLGLIGHLAETETNIKANRTQAA